VQYRFFFFFFLLSISIKAQFSINGTVLDSAQHRPLAFVSIAVKGFPKATAMSDIDGQFRIEIPHEYPIQIQLSSIGFKPEMLELKEAPNKPLRILLNPTSQQLRELVVHAGENPAHRIIRQTWKNRSINDPEQWEAYRCKTYNKLVLSGRPDTTFHSNDSLLIRKRNAYDSLFSQQHLFLIESSNERLFRKGKVKENVLGSKVSGMQEASVFMLALQFQPFGFYGAQIELSGKQLLNPISKNSEEVYAFSLEDTLFSGTDSIYVIKFQPRKNASTEGLKGVIYISAPDYAIQNIIASPASQDPSLEMSIRQQYKRMPNGRWFPEQLNTDLMFNSVKLTGFKMFGESRTYISEPEYNPTLSARLFDEAELDVKADAAKQKEPFWEEVRIEDLDPREQRTYFILDSISKAENLTPKFKLMEALVRGYLPISWFDLELNRIMRYNAHEGFRLGAGGITNDRLSKHFGLGGYAAWGFKDKKEKYGLEGRFYLFPKHEIEVRAAFSNDVWESGSMNMVVDRKPQRLEQIRQVLVSRMDAEERSEIYLSGRLRYLHADLFIRQAHLTPLYDYSFAGLAKGTRFSWLESGITLNYCFKEKFYRNGKLKISLGGKSPVFRLQVMQGQDLNHGGLTNYQRADFRMDYSKQWRRIGKTVLQIGAGYINGNVPYARLYNAKGNLNGAADFRAASQNCFETMRMNEFLSDQYAAAFVQHDMGSFFHIKQLKPRFLIAHNMMIGKLGKATYLNQQGIDVNMPSMGFFESGLQINNLMQANSGGYGLAGYYRYGSYSDANWKKNVAIKLTLSLLF
jgi:hypothetical protein